MSLIGKFTDWLFGVQQAEQTVQHGSNFDLEALFPNTQFTVYVPEKNKEQVVIVKDPSFKAETIKDFTPTKDLPKFIFRPRTLNEYVGQENAKAQVAINIRKVNELRPVHFLISGHRGCGKTTLAYIIKNELQAVMIERIAKQITNIDDVVNLINEINSYPEDQRVILFIDEIHSLDPKLCEVFYPVMEEFKISGKDVHRFIMIGATTEKHLLIKNNAPMVDRFQVNVELEQYEAGDIEHIIRQYHSQIYSQKKIEDQNFKIISENCKFTPRIAISLLEDNLIEAELTKVFKYKQIIVDGLTKTDLKILRILNENRKPTGEQIPIGARALANMTGIQEKDYIECYEPYLVRKELIIPTSRGRSIGTRGKLLLETLTCSK